MFGKPKGKISVTCTLWLLFLVCYCYFPTFSQSKSKIDTNTAKVQSAKLLYGCLNPNGISNYNLKKDSVLLDFFQRIDNNKSFKYNDTSSLLKLLNTAEGDSSNACFLPFLKMVDPEANNIYKENCYVSPMQRPFTIYCIEPPIQFSILFYLQFIVVDTLKLNKGVKISEIVLRNKKKPKNAPLTQTDYHKLYNLYRNWVVYANGNSRVKKPLHRSDYEWVLKYKDYVR
jgi:hypothetical protein